MISLDYKKKFWKKIPKLFLEGDMIETLSFFLSFIVIGDSGVTILSALIGELLSDDEDEPIHRQRLYK